MEAIRSLRHQATLLAGLLLFTAFLTIPVRAALGGNVSSVEADRQQLQGKRAVLSAVRYSVHEITTPYGTTVREFVSPEGRVFGVAWRGPFLPSFQQILGGYHAEFVQGAQQARAAQHRRGNEPLSIAHPTFVMHSAGHTRAYVGSAYLPQLVPAGVEAREIR